MIRVTHAHDVVTGSKKYYEFAGLSGDTKPTTSDICTGSLFVEVNTGDVYAFDEEGTTGEEWKQIAALGGGS